jgi:H+-transporting ATPase
MRLALTALLATIPLALPATFTLSAAFGAQTLARRGVLLTRLSAAHEAAAMDLLCADKTGTLTRNAIEVADVVALPPANGARVLALAALASSEGDQDPIDTAVRAAATAQRAQTDERVTRFVPFDPERRIAEAFALDSDSREMRIAKGAFAAICEIVPVPPDARHAADALAGQGHRVIAVAAGAADRLQLVGLIALADSPRDDAAPLVATLSALGVRTVMVTGDSAATAASIAAKVGIAGEVCTPERLAGDAPANACGVFARVLPQQKVEIVQALQRHGHVVGMCGDGTNDAPALRQAQIGVAVSSATDVAKAAAGMVMTRPGLAGMVFAVQEGRIAFQRLVAYTLNMMVKKIEVVMFLALGLLLTGHAVLTPTLMVLMLLTNDFLAMSLTTDRATPGDVPAVWRLRRLTATAAALGTAKLAFSLAVLAYGKFGLGLATPALQTLAFVALVAGNQAVLFVVRERGRLWNSRPGPWVFASSVADLALVAALVLLGVLVEPLAVGVLAGVLVAAAGFALLLDRIKLVVRPR